MFAYRIQNTLPRTKITDHYAVNALPDLIEALKKTDAKTASYGRHASQPQMMGVPTWALRSLLGAIGTATGANGGTVYYLKPKAEQTPYHK